MSNELGNDPYFEDDLDDEGDFQPDDSDNDDDEEEEEEGNQVGDGNNGKEDHAILTGTLTLNDEGRLVYSGTWCMSSELGSDESSSSDDKTKNAADTSSTTTSKKKKKKLKFKLKSKQQFSSPSSSNSKNIFDLSDPVKSKKHKSNGNSDGQGQCQRSMLFDGFFFMQKSSPETDDSETVKIKERDVEITFYKNAEEQKTPVDESKDEPQVSKTEENNDNEKIKDCCRTFLVKGKGCNEYGSFSLDGEYLVESGSTTFTITCHKRYDAANSKKRKGGSENAEGEYDDVEEEDDAFDPDEAADFNELIALGEEAEMSVEELRKRYMSGPPDESNANVDSIGNGADYQPQSKRRKTSASANHLLDDESSGDDECGF